MKSNRIAETEHMLDDVQAQLDCCRDMLNEATPVALLDAEWLRDLRIQAARIKANTARLDKQIAALALGSIPHDDGQDELPGFGPRAALGSV